MNQLQKYTWLIETIRRAGKISHKDLSARWERNAELSDSKPLCRATFNRWKDAISDQFGITIQCQKTGGYLYFIANPEDISQDRLKKWMLDSFAVGNTIGENLSLKGRILVDEIPSGRYHLTTMLEAMKENRVVNLTYKSFILPEPFTVLLEPYCVKLFDNRWYVLGRNETGQIRIYGLDRIQNAELTEKPFKLPKDFDAADYFSTVFGIVIGHDGEPEKIVIRAHNSHKHYLNSLPLHHSQQLIADCDKYADFELYLAPTYDFIMRLLHYGSMIEVISPASLRKTMKGKISDMYQFYKND